MTFTSKLFYLFFIILIISCSDTSKDLESVLIEAGNNRAELEKVLNHYNKNPTDSLKYKAAVFLIKNMKTHYSMEGHEGYFKVFEEANNYLIKKEFNKDTITNIWNNAMTRVPNISMSKKDDLNTISSEFLIENIELAFQAQSKLPKAFRPSKDVFFNFVLPYRLESEPLEKDVRRYLHEKYSWVYSALSETNSLEKTICMLKDSLNVQLLGKIYYPHYLPISQLEKLKVGNCGNIVNMIVHILRSLGIPCTKDYTMNWGNHLYNGHSWLVIFDKDKFIPLDAFDTRILNKLYKKASIPKAYRKVFYSNNIGGTITKVRDVTHLYKPKNKIELDIIDNDEQVVPLYVFGGNGTWKLGGYSTPGKKQTTFHNVGNNIIYATKDKKKDVIIPFYVDNDAKVQTFIPDFKNPIPTAILKRKWQPYKVRHPFKLKWIYSVDDSGIFGANKNDYSDAELITKVSIKDSRRHLIHVENKKKYAYYILKSSRFWKTPVHLSSFHLLNKDKQIIKSDFSVMVKGAEYRGADAKSVIDMDPLTFIEGQNLEVIYHLPKPINVKHFSVQPKNDDNNIRPQDEYQLMYWNAGWVSAGRKVAEADSLIYHEIPSNTVYWLKNLTRGREEHLFLIDENGQQFWPVSAYNEKEIYNEFLMTQQLCR